MEDYQNLFCAVLYATMDTHNECLVGFSSVFCVSFYIFTLTWANLHTLG